MKKILLTLMMVMTLFTFTGCYANNGTDKDIQTQIEVGNELSKNQPTPTDIEYSLERYNLIRRAYWVNGQREKAINLPCQITKPLGYIILFTESGNVIGQFTVDGKVSSLSSYLTPSLWYDSIYQEYKKNNGEGKDHGQWNWEQIELPDVDGSYGENDSFGIFFFTTDGKYIEWTGTYLYSDIPFNVKDTILGE